MFKAESPIHELQTISSDLLSAAVRGEIDLNKLAREVLANRGQDETGKWVGVDKAAEIHNAGITQ